MAKKKKAKEKTVSPLPKNLTIKKLEKLFRMFCVHTIEYEADTYSPDTWQNCNECILRDLPFVMKGSEIVGDCKRDLCFAIWHEGILNA